MKRIILLSILLVSIFTVSNAQSRNQKAKSLIISFFKENMNDFASYQSVSFSNVDSLFSSAADDPFIVSCYKNALECKNKLKLDSETFPDMSKTLEYAKKNSHKYTEETIYNLEMYELRRKQFESFLREFTPEFIGWKVIHKYRTKNEYNATILKNQEFCFDKDMKSITSISDVK